MLMTLALTLSLGWSLAHACPLVNHYRSLGYSDEQIEQYARSHDIPEWIIKIARSRCTK